ncbi:MAG: hypothetical protein OXI94_08725, partial [Gemmatimonadota bacterium]|nr:hypothetical protein [Gemmatimonadota bacterium]
YSHNIPPHFASLAIGLSLFSFNFESNHFAVFCPVPQNIPKVIIKIKKPNLKRLGFTIVPYNAAIAKPCLSVF